MEKAHKKKAEKEEIFQKLRLKKASLALITPFTGEISAKDACQST